MRLVTEEAIGNSTPLKTGAGTKRQFSYELVLTEDQGLMARESSTSELKAFPEEERSPPPKRHRRDKEEPHSSGEIIRSDSNSEQAEVKVPKNGKYAKKVWTMMKALKRYGSGKAGKQH